MLRSGKVTELVGRLNLEGNVKDTKKKIHWVLASAFQGLWWVLDESIGFLLPFVYDHMSHSLNSLKGGYIGDYTGNYYRAY